MISIRKGLVAGVALAGLGFFASVASAEDRPYTEGSVLTVSSIRTEYGKFEEYMKFLAGPWKQEMEASKKAGLINHYEVISVEAKGPNDPDVLLVVSVKNWAARDGMNEKVDDIAKQVYGSTSASDQASVDRSKLRRVLGSQTMQVLNLK
jgi:hypothetical protein